jgi:cell division protein FtsB
VTTLEERIAEAIDAYTESGAVPGMPDGFVYGTEERDGIARAVVAVLPTADVSDEAIRGAVDVADREWFALISPETDAEIGSRLAYIARALRPLFDAQAAAHAAEMGRWKERHKSAMAEVERLNDSLDYANKGKAELEAEAEALRAEVERLQEHVDNLQDRRVTAEAEVEALRAEVKRLTTELRHANAVLDEPALPASDETGWRA